jgi:Phosphoinositide phospholipase C, Ca2+-dependent
LHDGTAVENHQVMNLSLWRRCILVMCIWSSGCATPGPTSSVHLNQIQIIGSHNSYHLRAHDSLRALLAKRDPNVAKGLDYTHLPLPEQLSRLGIRQIELDCLADPQGGLYADPKGVHWAADAGLPPVPNHDPEGKLHQPGFKVMHVPDICQRPDGTGAKRAV